MRLKFYKTSRPSKHEKGLLKDINTLLAKIGKPKGWIKSAKPKTTTQLQTIFDKLSKEVTKAEPQKKAPPAQEKQANPPNKEQKVEHPLPKHPVIESTPVDQTPSKASPVVEPPPEIKEPAAQTLPVQAPVAEEPVAEIKEEVTSNNTETMSTDTAEISEPEVKVEVPRSFNPLADDIKQRGYSSPPISNEIDPIPEPHLDAGMAFIPAPSNEITSGQIEPNFYDQPPSFEYPPSQPPPYNQPPPPQEPPLQYTPYSQSPPQSQAPPVGETITNEVVNDLDAKDKKIACEQLADSALDAYKMMHTFAQNFIKVDDILIVEKIAKGEIDPTMQIPVDDKGTITNPVEFFKVYKSQVEEVISYDEEFGRKIKPPLVRIFMKKGWGLSDEQTVLYHVSKDLAVKGSLGYALKKQSSMIMQTFVDLQKEINKANIQSTTVAAPNVIITPPPVQQPVQPPPVKKESASAGAVETDFTEQPSSEPATESKA